MNPVQDRKDLIKVLQQASRRHQLWEVFSDAITMMAISLSNQVDFGQREEREAEYMQIIGRYEPDEVALFPRMFAKLVDALEGEPSDVLGTVFGELELGNAARGQFFTPYSLCAVMARTLIGDDGSLQRNIDERGFIRVHEPACGAGAMLIAFAEEFKKAGFNHSQQMHVHAVDVDRRAALMCYLQLSLLGIAAEVVVGNTLTLEVRERWFTPVHILEGWRWRLRDCQSDSEDVCRAGAADGIVCPPDSCDIDDEIRPDPAQSEAGQLVLF